jgi:small subunit ribosomal protein S6
VTQTQAAGTPAKKLAREYELVYILEPNVQPDEAERIANRVVDIVTKLGGKITKVDQWGRRKLAYSIKKATRGVFVCVKMVGYGDLVAELERNLRNADSVMRFQTVRKDGVFELDRVVVDAEETKFARIEAPPTDEPEATLEEKLGLNVKPRERSHDFDDVPEDFDMGGIGADTDAGPEN